MHSADFLPDGIHVDDLIGKEFVICKTLHDAVHLEVAPGEEKFNTLLDFSFSLGKVVVELLNELFAFFECLDVSLPPGVPLVLDHDASLLGAVHLEVEPGALDLLLVHLGGALLRGQHRLLHFLDGSQGLQLLLAYRRLLHSQTYQQRSFRIRFGS